MVCLHTNTHIVFMSIKSHFYCLIFQVTRSWLPLQPAGGSNHDGVSKVSAVRDYTKPEKVAVGPSSESWPPNNALPESYKFLSPFCKVQGGQSKSWSWKSVFKIGRMSLAPWKCCSQVAARGKSASICSCWKPQGDSSLSWGFGG